VRSTGAYQTGGSPEVGGVYRSSGTVGHYGAPIGVLLIDADTPFPPGSVGNACTYDHPVRYKVVQGCTVDRLVFEGDAALEASIVAAARELAAEGARAITANCGFMIRHQAAVSHSVDVPVLLSSLLLAPLLLASSGPHRQLGVVTTSASSLTDELLGLAGVTDRQRVVVGDLVDQPAFRAAMIDCTGELDTAAVERETVQVATALMLEHPHVATLLLECSELPPYAAAVQRATGVAVFDFVRLIDLFAAGFGPPRYSGFY
jgi:hypothetical protein